mmetsp:Transcript_3369/g.6333  ORF Transcript_3369/g.6333 Transcript_3369/m.6333 type:complete len:200 (-) Transcript_3369:225-824(-)
MPPDFASGLDFLMVVSALALIWCRLEVEGASIKSSISSTFSSLYNSSSLPSSPSSSSTSSSASCSKFFASDSRFELLSNFPSFTSSSIASTISSSSKSISLSFSSMVSSSFLSFNDWSCSSNDSISPNTSSPCDLARFALCSFPPDKWTVAEMMAKNRIAIVAMMAHFLLRLSGNDFTNMSPSSTWPILRPNSSSSPLR